MIVRNYFLITGKMNVDDIELLLFDTKGSLCFIVRHGNTYHLYDLNGKVCSNY